MNVKNTSTLRDEISQQNLRDSWYLTKDGELLDGPMALRWVELTLQSDPKSHFQIIHAENYDNGMRDWRDITAQTQEKRKKGCTFFRSFKSSKSERLKDDNVWGKIAQAPAANPISQKLLEHERHHSELIDAVQRLQAVLDNMQPEDPKTAASLRLAKVEVDYLNEQIWRNQHDIDALREGIAGAA